MIPERLFTTDEKDRIKQDAEDAYGRMYGRPDTLEERFFVMKGIESMAAVVYTAIEDKLRESE